MSLNIKNSETHKLVKELATLKGVSLTTAVTLAVLNEIEKEKSARNAAAPMNKKKRSDYLLEFAKEYTKRVKNPVHSWDIDSELYGEDGLPK
jgi:hypothetical protein